MSLLAKHELMKIIFALFVVVLLPSMVHCAPDAGTEARELLSDVGTRWTEETIVQAMRGRSRVYFPFLIRDGGFRNCMEIGVADGRFTELFLTVNRNVPHWDMHLVEPYPNFPLAKRYPPAGLHPIYSKSDESVEHRKIKRMRERAKHVEKWGSHNIGNGVKIHFYRNFSTDKDFLSNVKDMQLDFLYLDGDHSYKTVKEEIQLLWDSVRPGGVLAGHDYCNYGEPSLGCLGCENIPKCVKFTPYGVAEGKSPSKRSANQAGVVRAVQEWLVESQPELHLYHTVEDFTQESLAKVGIDYNLAITNTYNPSWFVVKPLK